MVTVLSRYYVPLTWCWEPLSRKRSLPQLLSCHVSRRHMATSAERWLNKSRVLVCHQEWSPASSFLWRMTWSWGLWVCTAFSVNVARCVLDSPVVHGDENKGALLAHVSWTSRQISGGRTGVQPWSPHKFLDTQISLPNLATWTDFSGRQLRWSSAQTLWTGKMTWL